MRTWKLLLHSRVVRWQILRLVAVLLEVNLLRRWVARVLFKRWLRAVLIHPQCIGVCFSVVALVWLMIWLSIVVVSL